MFKHPPPPGPARSAPSSGPARIKNRISSVIELIGPNNFLNVIFCVRVMHVKMVQIVQLAASRVPNKRKSKRKRLLQNCYSMQALV